MSQIITVVNLIYFRILLLKIENLRKRKHRKIDENGKIAAPWCE